MKYSLFSEEHATLYGESVPQSLISLNPSLLVTMTLNELEWRNLID